MCVHHVYKNSVSVCRHIHKYKYMYIHIHLHMHFYIERKTEKGGIKQ